jgi:hypothetical protein
VRTKAEPVVTSAEGGQAHCQINHPGLKQQVEFDGLEEATIKNKT